MDIQELRSQINECDERLIRAFEARMKVALEIGKYKKEHGMPVYDAAREQDVLEKQKAKVTVELAPYVESLYRTLFEVSRSYQEQVMTIETEAAKE